MLKTTKNITTSISRNFEQVLSVGEINSIDGGMLLTPCHGYNEIHGPSIAKIMLTNDDVCALLICKEPGVKWWTWGGGSIYECDSDTKNLSLEELLNDPNRKPFSMLGGSS